jgi:class 3 adenylate cyclase
VCIAYQVFGDGPVDVLHIWGPATHIEHMWDEPHHYRRIRREVERFGGREIRTLGDGFLAIFDGPARAIRCGCEIATDVRSGIATRVAAEASSGEVIVSGTVRDLVVGSGIEFADRVERELKDVPGIWRLYAAQP